MDNASYYSWLCEQVPVKSCTKAKLIDWLVYHNVSLYSGTKKDELYSIIQCICITRKYIVHEMAKARGHEVVRLPVTHCTLNPIKLVWAQVKGRIKSNAQFNLSECERLAWEGFSVVTPARWTSMVDKM